MDEKLKDEDNSAAPTAAELMDMAESGTNIREAGIDVSEMTPEPPAEDQQV